MTRVSQTVRQQVSQRAGGRCEYCCLPESYSLRFHVDHIVPIRKHGGTNGLENLAWACVICNSNKTSNIASFDPQTKQLTQLYNPRIQSWDEHFEIKDGFIVGKTAVGRTTIQVLDMNVLGQVDTRRYLIKAGLW